MKIPDAKAAVDKEWKKLETIPAWDVKKVKSKNVEIANLFLSVVILLSFVVCWWLIWFSTLTCMHRLHDIAYAVSVKTSHVHCTILNKKRRSKKRHRTTTMNFTLLHWWAYVIWRIRIWSHNSRSTKEESCFEETLCKTTPEPMQYLLNRVHQHHKWRPQR